MKRHIAFLLPLTLLFACQQNYNNNNETANEGVVFNPAPRTETIITHKASDAAGLRDTLRFNGRIKLSVMVPKEISSESQRLLSMKMLNVENASLIGGFGGVPNMVLATDVSVLDKHVTASVPALSQVRYCFSFYVAETYSGNVFGSTQIEIYGVGDTEELALRNAIQSIDINNPSLCLLLENSKIRIADYYNSYGESWIDRAEALANSGNLDAAITILSSIPEACETNYLKAQAKLNNILKLSYNLHSAQILSEMKSAMATFSNYEEVGAYYAMIPSDSECKEEADMLYNDYLNQSRSHESTMLEREDIQKDKEREYSLEKDRITAQIAIEGQIALLEKYTEEANYNRLPWLAKLIYAFL